MVSSIINCKYLIKFLRVVFRICCAPLRMVAGSIRIRKPSDDSALRAQLLRIREAHARNQIFDYSHVFRKKSRFDLIRLSCIIIGIELAYAAETAFVSPLLLEIGIQHKHMTMVWSLSPLLGFILAPLLGSISDRCQLSWGRRRPMILILSIFLFAGLLLVAWGRDFGILLGDKPIDTTNVITMNASTNSLADLHLTNYNAIHNMKPTHFSKWAAIIIVIGMVLLDFSADNVQTPARTYLLDVCIFDDQAKGLGTYTIMAGFGGCLGYALGGINWEEFQFGAFMGGNVKTIFTIVAIIFVVTCAITLTSFREIPLALIDRDAMLKPLSQFEVEKSRNNNVVYAITKGPFLADMEIPAQSILSKPQQQQQQPTSHLSEPSQPTSPSSSSPPPPPLANGKSILKNGIDVERQFSEKGPILEVDEPVTFVKYLKSIPCMPKSMKLLCFTNLISWMAHTCYSLYFTDFVGESIFMGDPTAPSGSAAFLLYQAGLRFGCWGMAIFALSCAMYSMTIERLIDVFGTKIVYVGGLLIFGIGMMLLSIYPTKLGVLILSVPAGVISATILTIPYLLIANYHSSGIFDTRLGECSPLKHTRGLGTDIAVITSMMFIAQIIVSLSIGPFISFIGSTNAIVYASSCMSLLAALSATQVMYVDF